LAVECSFLEVNFSKLSFVLKKTEKRAVFIYSIFLIIQKNNGFVKSLDRNIGYFSTLTAQGEYVRLTIDNINRAIDKKSEYRLSSYELSLYIYIAKRADLKGLMADINMTDVKATIGFSKQSFYNCLYSLEKKGFININMQKNVVGYEVLLTNNSFKSYKDTDQPYLNLYYKILEDFNFIQEPVQIKRFLLRALCFIGNKKWIITSDLLKKYDVKLKDIKTYFKIKESGRNYYGDTIYHLVMISNYCTTDTNVAYKSMHHRIKALLVNKRIPFTKEALEDVVSTALTYKELPSLVQRGILASENKDTLQPKLVTSMVTILRKKLKADPFGIATV